MLSETKLALRITTDAYDAEIASLIEAAAKDLTVAGIPVAGVAFTYGTSGVTDLSTVTDRLLMRAMITYVRANFGSPDDYDRVKASYDEQKAQLQTTACRRWSCDPRRRAHPHR